MKQKQLSLNEYFNDAIEDGKLNYPEIIVLILKGISFLNEKKDVSGEDKRRLLYSLIVDLVRSSNMEDMEKEMVYTSINPIIELVCSSKILDKVKRCCF